MRDREESRGRHTPGPWKIDQDGENFTIDADGAFGPNRWSAVALCTANNLGSRPITEEEASANARLIAAAPDLLAAIRETVRRFDENDATDALEAVDTLLRAAIAKAEGGAA